MRQPVLLFLVAVCVSFCAAKKEGAEEAKTKKGVEEGGGLPTGLMLLYQPKDRMIKAEKKLKMWIENKTGDDFAYEWLSEGKCGEFKFDKARAFEALLIGGKHAEDCRELVTFRASRAGNTIEKQFGVVVKGSAEFVEFEVRPKPIPESWLMINNYDRTLGGREVKCVLTVGGKVKKPSLGLAFETKEQKAKARDAAEIKARKEAAEKSGKEQEIIEIYDDVTQNLLDAPFLPWKFEFGACAFVDAPEDEEGVLALHYDLPHHDDYCGYFEHLRLRKDCEAGKFDATPYERLTFIVKSGDGEPHQVYAEMVAWEKFAEFHQGRTEPLGPFAVPADGWKRYEIALPKLYKDTLLPDSIKSVSFKVMRLNQPDTGVILFDNVALIRKGE